MRRIAYYGGSFDPVHRGHLEISKALKKQFGLDEFVFVPAFHAPHKSRRKPTSPFHRYAMLAIATREDPTASVSRIELDAPGRPYTVETLAKILDEKSGDRIFFVMGADSWEEITTWKEWETVLSIVDIIVVTRPGNEIGFDHVNDTIRKRITDMRQKTGLPVVEETSPSNRIFISDAVDVDVSSTRIRELIRECAVGWEKEVDADTASYIQKYKLYQTESPI